MGRVLSVVGDKQLAMICGLWTIAGGELVVDSGPCAGNPQWAVGNGSGFCGRDSCSGTSNGSGQEQGRAAMGVRVGFLWEIHMGVAMSMTMTMTIKATTENGSDHTNFGSNRKSQNIIEPIFVQEIIGI